MTGLPSGWVTIKLSDLSERITKGSTPTTYGFSYQDAGVRFVKAESLSGRRIIPERCAFINAEAHAAFLRSQLADGDVLFTIAGTLGRVGLVGETDLPANTNQAVAICRPLDKVLSPFIARYLESEHSSAAVQEAKRGVGLQNLNLQQVGDFQLGLPPLPEQRRIVRKLDTLSARSTTARTHLTAIEKLVERYQRAVTERLFEELLAEHGEKELGELCERVTKGASPNWQGFEYATEGIVFVRSQNVLWGALDLTDTAFLPPAFNDKQRNSVIRENDVLLNIVGASIGRSAVATSAISGANCNQAVAVIRLKAPTSSDARYLSQWLMSPAAQAQITENAVDVARANFSLGQAKQLKLPWPPAEIRRETLAKIETAFAKIDRLAAEAAKALRLLGHLDQRILAKAFAGDLVPQDPTDEPAEALLARIREARAAAPKGKRVRKPSV